MVFTPFTNKPTESMLKETQEHLPIITGNICRLQFLNSVVDNHNTLTNTLYNFLSHSQLDLVSTIFLLFLTM